MKAPGSSTQPDSSAMAAVMFMQHYGFVRAMAVRCAPWPDLVDDIFQQVFLEFAQGAAHWDLQKDLRPLLATLTKRVSSQHWKQVLRTQSEPLRKLAEHIKQIADGQIEETDWEAESNAMRKCLQRLPSESRTLLDLYYFQAISSEEIGNRLSMKVDTVRRALSRLREKLRECMQLNLRAGAQHG